MSLRLTFSVIFTMVLVVLGLSQLEQLPDAPPDVIDIAKFTSVVAIGAIWLLVFTDSALDIVIRLTRKMATAFVTQLSRHLGRKRVPRRAKVPACLLCLALVFATPSRAHAGASIFGFSVGDDTMTLGSILAEIIHQVKILNDVATMTRVMADNIAFMKDVVETGNDLVNGRWEALTEQFLMTVINSDENLREIYRNTAQIVTNRVPRGNAFRKLLMAGFQHAVFEAFGPYPFGRISTGSAYMDTSALRLNDMAREQMSKWKDEHRRIEQAINECKKSGSFQVCNSAANRMQIQAALHLEQLKAISAEQAQAEATKMAVESGERKQRQLAGQKDVTDVVEAATWLKSRYSSKSTSEVAR